MTLIPFAPNRRDSFNTLNGRIYGTKNSTPHPTGKKAVSMDKEKYDVLKKSILNILKTRGEFTHTEILKAVLEDFKKNKIKFEGSIEWNMEWVKLDLEARKEIKRVNTSPLKFAVAK